MKQVLAGLLLVGLLMGCTSREQEAQIDAFWTRQFLALQAKLGVSIPVKGKAAQLPANIGSALPASVSGGKLTRAMIPQADPIPATLFLSNSCGWCRKLKNSGFIEKFQNKYEGDVELKVYEVHSSEGNQAFSQALRKHHLSGGVPLLIIGNSVIHGYSDQMMALADEKVRLELKKLNRVPGQQVQAGPEVVSIAMEDVEIQGPASAEDKAQMKAYLNLTRDNHEATLISIQKMAPRQVWQEAMAIISQTENQLKQQADQSASYADFIAQATVLEKEQQTKIDELIRQNVKRIRAK